MSSLRRKIVAVALGDSGGRREPRRERNNRRHSAQGILRALTVTASLVKLIIINSKSQPSGSRKRQLPAHTKFRSKKRRHTVVTQKKLKNIGSPVRTQPLRAQTSRRLKIERGKPTSCLGIMKWKICRC